MKPFFKQVLDALVGHLPEILELMINGGENNGSESKVGILMFRNLLSKCKWQVVAKLFQMCEDR